MLGATRGLGLRPGPRAAAVDRPLHAAETIHTHGCSIVLRRVAGPLAREVFLHCRPPPEVTDPAGQAAAIYRAILVTLDAEGGSYEHVVAETLFLRDLPANLSAVREARGWALDAWDVTEHRPATLEIGQPPLDGRACLEVSLQVVVPEGSPLRVEPVATSSACDCAECTAAHGVSVRLGDEQRLHAAGLCAPGGDAYQQTLGMFGLAERLLQEAGMEFRDVVRTWIHLRHMERDYDALNRARREFFATRGIAPPPASTGIGGGPPSAAHDLCLGFCAVQADGPARAVMSTPTLNEASEYGADFVRGMKVVEANKVSLHVSGTASLDEHGRSLHPGDLEAQADRMLLNVAKLLEGQGAGYADVVHAITYVKHPGDAARVRERLQRAGFAGFPHVMVAAPICRPELLCETEALAVLAK